MRITTAKGAAAAAIVAGALLTGVIAAHPCQALAVQESNIVTAGSAVSEKLAVAVPESAAAEHAVANDASAKSASTGDAAAKSKASAGAGTAAVKSTGTASGAARNSAAKSTSTTSSGMKALGGNSTREAQQSITRKKARKIALEDACYKKKQVKKLKVRLGKRNGQDAFVVTFRFKKIRYSYAVAKWGGNIISRSAHVAKPGEFLA